MSQNQKIFLLLIYNCFFVLNAHAQSIEPDIKSYVLTIEPDIQKEYIKGWVVIDFEVAANTKAITLNSGNLKIDNVTGSSVLSFSNNDSKLIIQLLPQQHTKHRITVNYNGNPERGLLFNPTLNQAHTVYFTDHWMVCNNQPNDKATVSMNILIPKSLQCIASGELVETEEKGDKVLYKWKQSYETPAYTYGFVIGLFNQVTEQTDDVQFHYYSSKLKENELKKVFRETPNILTFFEAKSGIPYLQDSYSQVLIGSNYQEMSGLSVLSNSYPTSVLKDSSEIHLTSHELAHQWWGNLITCESFSHFWLNEAFAVYMASAFNEYKFGREKYLADIALYKGIYDDLLERGKDRSLIFDKWQPSRDNRNIVYYKGAYVLHLLRTELGDTNFWKGISLYSQRNYGKSVKTDDLKTAMEQASNTDLSSFFNKWVYQKS